MIENQKKKKIKKFRPKFQYLTKKNLVFDKFLTQSKNKQKNDQNYQKISNFKISKPKYSKNYIDINQNLKPEEKIEKAIEKQDTQQKLLKLNEDDMKQLKQQLNPEDYIVYNRNQIAKQKYGW